jgi:ParB family chromosome partitioning protein
MTQSEEKCEAKKFDSERRHGSDEILPGEQVVSIPLHKIRPNPFQPRKVFDDIDELAESIKEEGVLQPIIVRRVTDPTSEFLFEILSGERRWRGSKKAGKSHIPAIVREASEEDMKTKAALENTARKDLNFVETMNCYHILVEHYRDTVMVANKVGKSRKHVNEYLKIREEIYRHPKMAEIFEAQARSITYSAAKAFAEVAGKVYRLEKSNNREFLRVVRNMEGGVVRSMDWVVKKMIKSDKKEGQREMAVVPATEYMKETESELIFSVRLRKIPGPSGEMKKEIIRSIDQFREKVSALTLSGINNESVSPRG